MKTKQTKELKYARTPEAVGVSSAEVAAMIDDFMLNGQELHSLMILRHGKVACEVYRSPFNANSSHAMYSVSKSVTSTAIGFAVSEGLITLETRLIDVFPEFKPKKADEYLEKLNIYHLITMRSGKSVSPLANKEKDWLENFFNAGWYAEPGTDFLYVNENIYVLCAVIHRVTGQSVVEYLTPRLFEPLGIDTPYWETCPRGIEAGGWGLFLKTSDLAKIMLCYQQLGVYNGQRILPEDWIKDATRLHAESAQSQSASDSVVGYGYCFWRCAGYENAYRADGLFSQFGIVFEDLDACLICTGGDIGTQQMRDTIWRHVPACFIPDAPRKRTTTELTIPAYSMLPIMARSSLEETLENKRLTFGKSVVLNAAGFPTSVIPFPGVFMEKDRAGNINDVFFRFSKNDMEMTWSEGDETNTIQIGLDGKYRITPILLGKTNYTAYSHAAWLTDDELEIRIRLIECVAERILNFKFRGSRVTLKPSSLPTIQEISETFKSKIRDVIKQPVIQPLLTEAVPRLSGVIDGTLRGSIENDDDKAQPVEEVPTSDADSEAQAVGILTRISQVFVTDRVSQYMARRGVKKESTEAADDACEAEAFDLDKLKKYILEKASAPVADDDSYAEGYSDAMLDILAKIDGETVTQ